MQDRKNVAKLHRHKLKRERHLRKIMNYTINFEKAQRDEFIREGGEMTLSNTPGKESFLSSSPFKHGMNIHE